MILTDALKRAISKNYVTHYNYAKCMVGMMHGLQINVPVDKTVSVKFKEVRRFLKLADLTASSIEGEIASCHTEEDYAQIVAPWIAVKCYYRIYYLESVLIHLASGTEDVFKNGGHNYVRKTIRTYCKNGYIVSKLKNAEVVVGLNAAMGHKISSGANLSANYYLSNDCVKSVRHKIAEYSQEHWKKNQRYKNYRGAIAKADLLDYVTKNEVSLFDYFYQMRLKSNYRDTDFLDFSIITSNEGVKYIDLLKAATDKYSKTLETAINNLLTVRSIKL